MLHYHTERCRVGKTSVTCYIQECLSPLVTSSGHFQVRKALARRHKVGRLVSGEDGRLHAEVSERNRMSKDYCFLSRSVFLDLLSLFFCRDSSSNPSLGSCPCISSYTMHDSPCLHCLCTLSLVSVCVTWFNQCVCTRCLSLDKRMAQ